MWTLGQINNPTNATLWFSDGEPTLKERGGHAQSDRLIVEKQGFIDISDFPAITPISTLPNTLDLNNNSVVYVTLPAVVDLVLPGDGSFRFRTQGGSGGAGWVLGKLKPTPEILDTDARFMSEMISSHYVPYQNIPTEDAPGKPDEEIKALGRRFFPFTPHSYELAMSVYDWTTPSFARLVFMKIFAYTSLQQTPYPLDSKSIAEGINNSNWGDYTPKNVDYMNSFMMKPAESLTDVQDQLAIVQPRLQKFAEVQNRMLSAAFASMPRTSLLHAPRLFSGQPDISQLGLSHFAIDFLECPLNAGPPGVELQMAFNQATSSFIQKGEIITTKMVWSFADSLDVAAHYSNGLILIANPPDDESRTWEAASYITPLSDDPDKNEYTFAPGTSFIVESLEQGTIPDKGPVQFLTLRLHVPGTTSNSDEANSLPRPWLSDIPARRIDYPPYDHYHTRHTGGRRCHCVEQAERAKA